MDAIRRFLQFCLEYNFRLHPRKCTLYATSVRWYGRIIEPDRISFGPQRFDGTRNMTSPRTGSEHQQFICSMQWMQSDVPKISTVTGPLATFMKQVYAIVRKRTRRAVAKVSLEFVGWSSIHEKSFVACQRALKHQVTLVYVDLNKGLCVFKAASDLLWAGVISQTPYANLYLLIQDQRHAPLTFLSEHFRDAELRRPTIEKEAYAIMAVMERMH